MSQRIETFRQTVGAFSTATPTLTFSSPLGEITALEITFPRGCNNLVTVNVLYSGTIVIPKTPGALVAGNGETFHFEMDGYPTGVGWQVGLNNADTAYAHTIQLVFFVDEVEGTDVFNLPPVLLLNTT